MLLRTELRLALAQLLGFMARGEHIAHACALRQASFAPSDKIRRFLQEQARQELMHARVFTTAAAWLAPRASQCAAQLVPLEHYHVLLQAALARKDISESLLAEQVIFESLGEVILHRLVAGLARHKLPVHHVCRRMLVQEHAHHAFGDRLLERAIDTGAVSREGLRVRGQEYLLLLETILARLANLLAVLEEDASTYFTETRRHLPDWLTADVSAVARVTPLAAGNDLLPQ